jgi:hypothetical protein
MFAFGMFASRAVSIAVGVAAARLGGDGDLADELGPGGGAAAVGDRLLPLDLLPFTMAGHDAPLRVEPRVPTDPQTPRN